MRYAREADFADWGHRLEVFGLDLRHTPSVESFCHELVTTRQRLDFIVNNACQTVRRPPDFYAHMMADETAALRRDARRTCASSSAPTKGCAGTTCSQRPVAPPLRCTRRDGRQELAGLTHAAALSQVPLLPEELLAQKDLFPDGQLDQDLQQVDLRGRNSWRLLLAEVSSVELLEVQLVNAIAPFVLNARLKPLMLRTPNRDKHIVNVSAVEGQFYRNFKTTRHPHTNMAKAALNMMTRTAATDYHARRHPHEQRGHRLGDRRGSGRDRRRARRPSTASIRRSTSSTARRASSIRSSTASTPADMCGASF